MAGITIQKQFNTMVKMTSQSLWIGTDAATFACLKWGRLNRTVQFEV